MADEDTIVIEDEAPQGAAEHHDGAPDPLEELQAQKAGLEAERDAERARADRERQRAEQEARGRADAEREAQTARTEVTDSRLSTVEQGLSSAQTESDAAQAAWATAMQEGNFAEAAKQQTRIARAAAQIERLHEAKSDLEAVKASPRTEQRRDERQPAAPDPVETFIANRDPGTQAWLRSHMDDARILATGSNPRRASKLQAADADAFSEGYERGSKEYFTHVEKFLGMSKEAPKPEQKTNGADNKAADKVTVQAHTRRAPSAPVAPVNSGSYSGVSRSDSGYIVRLTEGQKKTAQDGTIVWRQHDLAAGRIKDKSLIGKPIGVQEYARRIVEAEKESKYADNYYNQ